MKQTLKTSFEYDAILCRRLYKYTGRAGVAKKAKRQVNRRARRDDSWREESEGRDET